MKKEFIETIVFELVDKLKKPQIGWQRLAKFR